MTGQHNNYTTTAACAGNSARSWYGCLPVCWVQSMVPEGMQWIRSRLHVKGRQRRQGCQHQRPEVRIYDAGQGSSITSIIGSTFLTTETSPQCPNPKACASGARHNGSASAHCNPTCLCTYVPSVRTYLCAISVGGIGAGRRSGAGKAI